MNIAKAWEGYRDEVLLGVDDEDLRMTFYAGAMSVLGIVDGARNELKAETIRALRRDLGAFNAAVVAQSIAEDAIEKAAR